jgi:hypothetical protein
MVEPGTHTRLPPSSDDDDPLTPDVEPPSDEPEPDVLPSPLEPSPLEPSPLVPSSTVPLPSAVLPLAVESAELLPLSPVPFDVLDKDDDCEPEPSVESPTVPTVPLALASPRVASSLPHATESETKTSPTRVPRIRIGRV